ncbi:MAG: sigma-E factor negative regulatory protein [Nitrosospira sp.]|nr:sigma-E factor negative regulatory protein [Nitrosospira sp.]MDW7642281.1 sigma-E factor negative regulatory protein [Nitrosomonadaceae bacterium]MBI0408045.1 sigma-E factor negative regulatory protein [Nitrosospira sp.]MBI0414018.1 sigma-E factor negative regulatory protein [Nitrosospira sp.]MBI0415933.1 sigma-E factor negative regulatory protein [Nitrosospira sp.]
MKDRISALMDGELDDEDVVKTISEINEDHALREEWATYHLIGDILRQSATVSNNVTSNANERLALESNVTALHSSFKRRDNMPIFSIAASMLVGIVIGWVSQPTGLLDTTPADQIALQASVESTPAVTGIPVSARISDYMTVHQGFLSKEAVSKSIKPRTPGVTDPQKNFQ